MYGLTHSLYHPWGYQAVYSIMDTLSADSYLLVWLLFANVIMRLLLA